MTDETIDEQSLRRLRSITAKLPRDVAPPEDAWAAVKAEIDNYRRSPEVARTDTRALALWQRPALLAAAAVVLVAGSAAITAILLDQSGVGREIESVREIAAVPGTVASSRVAPSTLAEFTVAENDYISTTNRLSALLESEDTELAPETIAKLRESLRVIDAAILEARQALATDPANRQLMEMLSTSYNQKVDLLKRTTDMGRS